MRAIQLLGTGMHIRRICVAIFTLFFTATAFADAGEDFKLLLDEAWDTKIANEPMFASKLGDRRFNEYWKDLNISAVEARQQQTREFLRRTYAINKSALSEDEQLNYELFRRTLQDLVDAYQFNAHLMPLHHRGGVQNLENNTNYLSFESVKDYDDWLLRMSKIGDYIDQTIKLAEVGRKKGLLPPKILMQRIPDQIALQLVGNI